MKTLKQYSILAFLSFCICTSCTQENGIGEINPQGKGYLEVFASIGETYTSQTKADESTEESPKRAEVDEYFSFKSTSDGGGFKDGCQIGIYSLYSTEGKFDNNRLANVPLTYMGGSFSNEEINIESMTNLGRTFVYYPYSKGTPQNCSETGNKLMYPIELEYGDNDPNKLQNDKNRVIDLLTASNSGSLSSGRIYYTFSHACSMLIIYRGDGFILGKDNELQDEVEVKLKTGRKAFVVSENKGNFKLLVEDDNTKDNLIYPANVYYDEEYNQSVNTVILPPGAEVEYIKIKDMFGTVQYIYPKDILEPMTAGKKQPVTVKLDGLDPTIFPHEITDWEDNIITIETQNPGIYNLEGFNNWLMAYNNNNNELEKYGTKENDKWTFHIYSDIDFKETTGFQTFIPNFKDNLDGHGHTLKNISLNKTENAGSNFGFISELNGSINNLKIEGITITGSNDENNYVGTIAGVVKDGSITNCKITGIDIECEKGYIGALAGSITNSIVKTCLLEGNLKLGKDAKNDENSYKLFGIGQDVTINPEDINTVKVNIFKAEN